MAQIERLLHITIGLTFGDAEGRHQPVANGRYRHGKAHQVDCEIKSLHLAQRAHAMHSADLVEAIAYLLLYMVVSVDQPQLRHEVSDK